MRGLSLVVASGGHSSSRCAGLSLSRPLLLHRLQTRRLSSCGSRAQPLCGMWDLPRPGLEPMSPALAGRLSTTVPPGKPLKTLKKKPHKWDHTLPLGLSLAFPFNTTWRSLHVSALSVHTDLPYSFLCLHSIPWMDIL